MTIDRLEVVGFSDSTGLSYLLHLDGSFWIFSIDEPASMNTLERRVRWPRVFQLDNSIFLEYVHKSTPSQIVLNDSPKLTL